MLSLKEEKPEHIALKHLFLKRTGYGEYDILSLNYSTRIFFTRNGGKYLLNVLGEVDWIAGPPVDPEERL